MSITPGYLTVFRIPLLRGRDFTVNDNADAPAVDLVNEAFARKFFPGQDPVGQHILHGSLNASSSMRIETIVGLVADFHQRGLAKPADPMIIATIPQVSDGYNAAYANLQPLFWMVRTHDDPRALIPAISEQLRAASDGFGVGHIRTMDEVMVLSTAWQRFEMWLLSIFGGAALLLAAIGIYAVISWSVVQRTREIGIRMALGADRGAIRRLLVSQGMLLALAGVALGIAAAFALTRIVAGLLFGVTAWDPGVFLTAAIVLATVAFLAAWLPALHASRLEPIRALHAE